LLEHHLDSKLKYYLDKTKGLKVFKL